MFIALITKKTIYLIAGLGSTWHIHLMQNLLVFH